MEGKGLNKITTAVITHMMQIRFVPKPAQSDGVSPFITCKTNVHWLKERRNN